MNIYTTLPGWQLYNQLESSKRCIPYMYQSLGWGESTKISKFNTVYPTDCQEDNQLIVRIAQWINSDPGIKKAIKAFVVLGDCISSIEIPKVSHTILMNKFMVQLASLQIDIPILYTPGNHCLNISESRTAAGVANWYSRAELKAIYFDKLKLITPSIVLNESDPNCNYYYKDFTTEKIRMIFLNPYDYPYNEDVNADGSAKYTIAQSTENFAYSETQLNWLVSSLNVPSNWAVIVHQHPPFVVHTNSIGRSDLCLRDILIAFKNKTTVTTSATSPTIFTITGNFSTNSGKIACFNGHEHEPTYSLDNGIPCVQCISGDYTNGMARITGSVNKDAADIAAINTSNFKMSLLRYGTVDSTSGIRYVDDNEIQI